MKPSLQDVARRAGVSPSAASAALREGPSGSVRLAEATRRRVHRAADELGYRSNPLARGLRGQSTRTVGVLWWLGSPPARQFMARRLARTFQQRGYATYIADHFSSPRHVTQTLSDFALRGVDGVVIESVPAVIADAAVRAALRGFRAAVVVGATADRRRLDADVIVHDRCTGIREAVGHFAAIGRRRPLFLVARHAAEGKAEAFREALRRHGMRVSVGSLVHVDESQSDNVARLGFDALAAHHRKAKPRSPRCDALLATSDELAVGAIAWLREQGRRVPDEVAVVGFNDTHFAPFLDPPLASVDRREEQLVAEIETRLFTRLDRPGSPPTRLHLPMRFVWRDSAGGAAASAAS